MRELVGWNVEVKEVKYMPELDAPADKPHPFVYFIRIWSDAEEVVKLVARKWIVREDHGEVVVVEGDGVVGETPIFQYGSEFSYHSYHVVACSATVQGSYFGETQNGEKVFTRIPEFRLEV
jgi:ApaG protein